MPFKPVPPDRDPMAPGRTLGKGRPKKKAKRQKRASYGKGYDGVTSKNMKNC